MDWTVFVDGYCERTAPGLFNEPINAISNASFLIVAAWAARTAWRQGADAALWILVVLVGAIGFGSLAFHTFATRWAMLADVLPIAAFIYGFLGFALRRFFSAGWFATLAAVGGLALVNTAVDRFLPPGLLNGSVAYIPALAAAVVTAIGAHGRGLAVSAQLLGAAVALTLSVMFRTADAAACNIIPWGTHFIWHLLNAVVLGLYLDAALRHGARRLPATK